MKDIYVKQIVLKIYIYETSRHIDTAGYENLLIIEFQLIVTCDENILFTLRTILQET